MPGDGHPSLHLLPLEAAAGPPRPRDPAAAGAQGAADGQRHQPLVEQRVVAFALGHPGFGPARIAAELAQPRWVGSCSRATGCGGCCAATASPRGPGALGWWPATPPHRRRNTLPPPERHLDVDHPGQLVQLDCFCIGRLAATTGTVWQDTAIDVASAYTWAARQVTRRNPAATWTSALARQVAADLAARGWRLEQVMSDNASEFRSATFQQTIRQLGARHTFIRAGRPRRMVCGAGPADHLGRVLEAGLGSLPHPQADRPPLGPGTLPALLQHRTRPHRPLDPRPYPQAVLGKAKLWQKKR